MLFRFRGSFIEYAKDGLKYIRVKFYIQGSEPGKQGTVHLEVKEVRSRGGEPIPSVRPWNALDRKMTP